VIYYFGPFVLKPEQYGLEVAGQPRQLQPKVFELLTFLVANRDRVVSKEELLRNIWQDAFVSDAAISRAVSEARKVLAAGGSADWITTVYGRGFRFTGPVIEDLAAPEGDPSGAVPRPPEEERGLSIAVLPFADRSPQRDQAHLCEGMAEEILHRLAHVVGLRVTARGVSFQYDALADPREVGRQIGADLVLEGTVRKEGDELRIGVEVTDARTGIQVWSEQWQRHSQQIFALQDQTASLIAETLELHLAPDAPPHEARARRRAGPTTSTCGGAVSTTRRARGPTTRRGGCSRRRSSSIPSTPWPTLRPPTAPPASTCSTSRAKRT